MTREPRVFSRRILNAHGDPKKLPAPDTDRALRATIRRGIRLYHRSIIP